MSFKNCGNPVDVSSGGLTTYRGNDGNIYQVADTATININGTLTFDAANTPQLRTQWTTGPEYVEGAGVILDSLGNEIVKFYPYGRNNKATRSNPTAFTQPSNPPSSLASGEYTILTFVTRASLFGAQPNTFGHAQICLQGLFTPDATPNPTFPATSPPTPTPATPTPTPTATAETTALPTPVPTNPVPDPLAPIPDQYTLTYSDGAQGWPSFYSYHPDYMLGMNNFFYTFSGGNLYRHNTNNSRNNFYNQQFPATITTVFNESPLENKLFKNISLESNGSWTSTFLTDMNNQGAVNSTWFEQKEGAYYAAIKNTAQAPAELKDFVLRSVNGIGRTTGYSVDNPRIFNFSVSIDSIISIGDYLYYVNEYDNTPALAGVITAISTSSITVDSTINGATNPTTNTPLILAFKNTLAESHGLLGHYCLTTLQHNGPLSVELFAIESQVMKSFP